VIYSTAIGDMVLNGTALTPAAESLTPLSALFRAFPGVFLSSGETPPPPAARAARRSKSFSARPGPSDMGCSFGRAAALAGAGPAGHPVEHPHQKRVRREPRLQLQFRRARAPFKLPMQMDRYRARRPVFYVVRILVYLCAVRPEAKAAQGECKKKRPGSICAPPALWLRNVGGYCGSLMQQILGFWSQGSWPEAPPETIRERSEAHGSAKPRLYAWLDQPFSANERAVQHLSKRNHDQH
jgi:hypothetical protein